jgi:hypothetical protein
MTREYYGTKLVLAWPAQGKDPVSGIYELGPEGYAVKYADGYTSWSPKDVFEAAYQPLDALSFGHAICALKSGKAVSRSGWNGKGMFLVLVPGSNITVQEGRPLARILPVGEPIEYLPHIDMKTSDGKMVPWLASQTDILANDWYVVVN